MDPLAQRGIGKVQRIGDRLEAVPLDDRADGLGTAEEAGPPCLRLGGVQRGGRGVGEEAGLPALLEEGIQGGESLIGKVEFEGPHSSDLQEKLLQKFTRVHSLWILLSEQNLFDSNFSGAAYSREATIDASLDEHLLDGAWLDTD